MSDAVQALTCTCALKRQSGAVTVTVHPLRSASEARTAAATRTRRLVIAAPTPAVVICADSKPVPADAKLPATVPCTRTSSCS